MVMSLWPRFFWPTLYMYRSWITAGNSRPYLRSLRVIRPNMPTYTDLLPHNDDVCYKEV